MGLAEVSRRNLAAHNGVNDALRTGTRCLRIAPTWLAALSLGAADTLLIKQASLE